MQIKYPLFYPSVNKERILQELSKVLDSKFIGQGPVTIEWENQLEDFLNDYYPAVTNKVVAVNSGTSALHLSYILADIKEDDEVITPALNCTADAHALLWQRAVPVFADIQINTLNIDPEDIKRKITKKTKAIIVMHNGGLSCDMDEIMEIALEHHLSVIEDASQAFGGEYKNRKLGTIGNLGTFSFQAIKNYSCGDGGAIVCQDKEDYERAKRLRWFAIPRETKIKANWQPFLQRRMTFDIEEVGYKYQPTDIDAAIGIAQLNNVRQNLEIRKKYAQIYRQELSGIDKIILLKEDSGHANWLFQIILNGIDRENFQKELGKNGIETNMVQLDNRMYSVFKKYSTNCPNMDKIQENYLSLPLHPKLSEQDIYDICTIIKKICVTF